MRFRIFPKARPARGPFKARSANRDIETDQVRASSVLDAIEEALQMAKAEQAGLKARIDDVLARAAVTMGNGSDEYLTRDRKDTQYQDSMGTEIAGGQRRLSELAATIGHFQFLRTALLTRFSQFSLLHPASSPSPPLGR
jgi:hypothetical protein